MNAIDVLKKDISKPVVSSLQDLIERSAKELGRALPEHMRPERLVRIALTSIRLNPELARCTQESFLGALFTAAQVGLEPVAGRSYLIPFRNSRQIAGKWEKVSEVQFVIGFKGLIELFYRHEAALSIDMNVVHDKDMFSYQHGTDPFLHHTPAIKNRGEVVGYYAVAKIKGGGSVFHFMSKQDALAHGQKHSKTFDSKKEEFYASSPWAKEFDAMAQKTVLIQLAKRLPMAVELQRAISADETSRDFRRGVSDVLDIPATTDWTETTAESKPDSKVEEPVNQEQGDGDYNPAEDQTRFITAKQRGLVHGKFKATGQPETVLRDYLADTFGKESTSAIPADSMDKVLKWIESLKS